MNEPTPTPQPEPAPGPDPIKPPVAEPPIVAQPADPADPADPEPASLPDVVAEAPTVEGLQAQIEALHEAQAITAASAKEAGERAASLALEAVSARQSAARAGIGLPAHMAALMPPGDPADPAVAQAIEAFRTDPKFAPVFQSRTAAHDGMDLAEFDRRLGEKTESVFSTRTSRAEGWNKMKGRI